VIRLGLCGVLLLVGFPVRTCAVPLVATLLNAKLKVRRAVLLPVLEIYPAQVSVNMKKCLENDDLDYELASRCVANNTPKDSSSSRRQSARDILVTTVLTEELLNIETGRPIDISGTDRGHLNGNAEREIQHSLESKKIGGLVKSIGCFSIRIRTLPIGY